MKPHPLTTHLECFGAPGPVARSAPETAALIDAARREGAAEAERLARAEADLRAHESERALEERLEAERLRWRAECASDLSAKVTDAFAMMKSDIAVSLAAVLAPVLDEVLAARVMQEFRAALDEALADRDVASFELRGPADATDPIARAFAAERITIRRAQGDETALVARINGALIRASLAPVLAAIGQARHE